MSDSVEWLRKYANIIKYGDGKRLTDISDELEAAQRENERMRIAIKTIATFASIAEDAMKAKP